MNPIQCLLWIIVGGIAGSLAHQLVGGRGGGFISDVILGLIGAIVGGFILGFFGVDFGGRDFPLMACCANVIVATFGASVLIVIGRVLSGNRTA